MTTETQQLSILVARLEHLEKENRGLKNGGLIVLIVAIFALSVSISSLRRAAPLMPNRSTGRRASAIEADTITAHEFVLAGRHNGGKPIALLTNGAKAGEYPDEPVLQFFGPEPLADEGRVLRMTIGATPFPDISIYPAFGPTKAGDDKLLWLNAVGNEPQLFMSSGRGNLAGVNHGGFLLGFDDGVPTLSLCCGKNGKMLWLTPKH